MQPQYSTTSTGNCLASTPSPLGCSPVAMDGIPEATPGKAPPTPPQDIAALCRRVVLFLVGPLWL